MKRQKRKNPITGSGGIRRKRNGPYAGTLLGSLLFLMATIAPAIANAFLM